jgi:glycerol-3-phosphate acyltransferase PlsX
MTDSQTSAGPETQRTILSIDAMGGDEGPAAIVAGIARSAKENRDVGFILHGRANILKPLVEKRKLTAICEIRDVPDVVQMTDKPSQTLRTGKNTSMW